MARDTRLRMLEATSRLLQHRGYHGTGVNDVLTESGAPRGSLYFHFPGGKEQLAIEATEASVKEATNALRECLTGAASPDAGVRRYVELAADLMRQSDYTFGCPVAPVILDAAEGLPKLQELCRSALATWTSMLRDAFVVSGMETKRADSLATLAVASIEGSLLMARANRDCNALLRVAMALEEIVRSALPRRMPRAGKPRAVRR